MNDYMSEIYEIIDSTHQAARDQSDIMHDIIEAGNLRVAIKIISQADETIKSLYKQAVLEYNVSIVDRLRENSDDEGGSFF